MDEFTDTNQPWLEQVYGSFNASRLDMRLFGRHPEEFHPDSTTVGAMATYVHEHMHYFQTLFTGFGHIFWSSHRQSTGYSVRIWTELAGKGLGYRLPLAAYSDDPVGGPIALTTDLSAREMARLSAARFNLPIPNWTFKELKTRLLKTDWVINPVVELAGEKVCLQGKDILEGQAHFVERTLVESLTSNSEVSWDRTGVPPNTLARSTISSNDVDMLVAPSSRLFVIWRSKLLGLLQFQKPKKNGVGLVHLGALYRSLIFLQPITVFHLERLRTGQTDSQNLLRIFFQGSATWLLRKSLRSDLKHSPVFPGCSRSSR